MSSRRNDSYDRDLARDRDMDEAHILESEYRGSVRDQFAELARQIKASADSNQQTAIIQERMMGLLDEHDKRLRAQSRRIRALEQQPEQQRQQAQARWSLANMSVGNLIALGVFIIGIISLLYAHPIAILK